MTKNRQAGEMYLNILLLAVRNKLIYSAIPPPKRDYRSRQRQRYVGEVAHNTLI